MAVTKEESVEVPITGEHEDATVTNAEAEQPQTLLTKQEFKKKNAKMYAKVAFLYGLLCSVLPIIITELIWDSIAKRSGVDMSGLGTPFST